VFSRSVGTVTPSNQAVASGYVASGVKPHAPGSEKAASHSVE